MMICNLLTSVGSIIRFAPPVVDVVSEHGLTMLLPVSLKHWELLEHGGCLLMSMRVEDIRGQPAEHEDIGYRAVTACCPTMLVDALFTCVIDELQPSRDLVVATLDAPFSSTLHVGLRDLPQGA